MLTATTTMSCQSRLDPIETAEAAFRQAYPAYAATRQLDELRASRVQPRLDRQGHVYLDYTGGGLYAECQLRDHLALLARRRLWQPSLQKSDLDGHDRPGRARPARRCWTTSTPRPTNTW